MKKIKEEIDFDIISINVENVPNIWGCEVNKRYTYKIVVDEPLDNVKIIKKTETPETIVEFLETHKLSEVNIIEWLNENYGNNG